MTQIQYSGNAHPLTGPGMHVPTGTLADHDAHTEPQNRPAEEWTGDGVNNGDCWFPIHFSYQGIHYTADVQQKTGTVKEFHVCGMTPAVIHLPEPYVVAEHFSKQKYDFPVNEMFYPASFGHAVIEAIEEGSNQELL